MRVELLRGSEADLLENYVRLEGLRPGLGDRFYRMLDLALARLRQFPESAPVCQGAYRRLILRPFLSSRISCRWFRLRQGYGVARRR